jgi:hypothetical protein
MTMIMVSYRRADAQDMAGRISDYLIGKYGEKSVFFDVSSIGTGVDYRRRIERAIISSDVVIAIIGLNWLGKTSDGKPRVHDRSDPVRIEIETALAHKKPILPLLVNGATMPEELDLPDSLHDLHYSNAAKIDSGRDFRMHMSYLVQSINETLGISEPAPVVPTPSRLGRIPLYGAGVLAILALFAVLFWTETGPFEQQAAMTPTVAAPPPVQTAATPIVAAPPPAPTAAPTVPSRAATNSGFIFPDSDRRILSKDDLQGLSATELRFARNEIYARHGHIFVDQSLAKYFEQFPWYHPRSPEGALNPVESANVATIQLAERP